MIDNGGLEVLKGCSFYAQVHLRSRETVASAFSAMGGWKIRKAGFEELEAMSESGELIIESSDPVLVHGEVLPIEFVSVNKVLSSFGRPWKSELYDEQGTLVKSYGAGST